MQKLRGGYFKPCRSQTAACWKSLRVHMEQELADKMAQQQADLDEQLAFVQVSLICLAAVPQGRWLQQLQMVYRLLHVCTTCMFWTELCQQLQQLSWACKHLHGSLEVANVRKFPAAVWKSLAMLALLLDCVSLVKQLQCLVILLVSCRPSFKRRSSSGSMPKHSMRMC